MLDEPGCNPQTSRARFGRSAPDFAPRGAGVAATASLIHRICSAGAPGFHTATADPQEVIG